MSKNYRSQLVGLFGDPVDENPTGVMMEAGFAVDGLDYRYVTMHVKPEHLQTAVAALRAMEFRGVNLTIPHKVSAMDFLDRLSPAAQKIGAANVIVNDGGELIGENTDGKGFLKSLEDAGVCVRGKTVTLLGAGGAARAIGVECALAGAEKVIVINRSRERGQELVSLLSERTDAAAEYSPWEENMDIPAETDILVQATSLGLFPNVAELPQINYDSISPDVVASDVIFNDANTRFLQRCAQRGCLCINGLGMLVNQGVLAYKLWTGQNAPVDVMTQALRRAFDAD